MMTEKPIAAPSSLFLDSGGFSLAKLESKYRHKHGGPRYAYYESTEFWEYMESYVAFIKKYHYAIDYYANIDVIGQPEITWRNQKWLEKKGLRPMPVVHYGTKLSWLRTYINDGYSMIGLGGLVKKMTSPGAKEWIRHCFELVCQSPTRTPTVKLHGFGISSFHLICNFPWYSIDSTDYIAKASKGKINVPIKRDGRYRYDQPPHIFKVACTKPSTKKDMMGKKYKQELTREQLRLVIEWCKEIEIPLGRFNANTGEILELGVLTSVYNRFGAMIEYYHRMIACLPPYPWPLPKIRGRGFNLTHDSIL